MFFIFLISCSVSYAINDIMALQGQVRDISGDRVFGNITVTIHDSALGGNNVYDSGTDFYGALGDGQYDLMLGSGPNKMNLSLGERYYLDLIINGEDVDFDGDERFEFQSSVGTLKNVNLSGDRLSIMDGNVGIGTANPNSPLHINHQAPIIRLQDSDASTSTQMGSYIGFYNGSGSEMGYVGYGSTSNNLMTLNNAYGNIFIGGNNVGVGTTSPTQKLDVSGNVKANSYLNLDSSMTMITARATIGSSATSTWYGYAYCPSGYSIVYVAKRRELMYWGSMTHWYSYCDFYNNGIRAQLYTQNGYASHWMECSGLCVKN